jgi:hypothetical protein
MEISFATVPLLARLKALALRLRTALVPVTRGLKRPALPFPALALALTAEWRASFALALPSFALALAVELVVRVAAWSLIAAWPATLPKWPWAAALSLLAARPAALFLIAAWAATLPKWPWPATWAMIAARPATLFLIAAWAATLPKWPWPAAWSMIAARPAALFLIAAWAATLPKWPWPAAWSMIAARPAALFLIAVWAATLPKWPWPAADATLVMVEGRPARTAAPIVMWRFHCAKRYSRAQRGCTAASPWTPLAQAGMVTQTSVGARLSYTPPRNM